MYACPANQYGEIKFWCGDVSKNRTCYADNKKPNSFSFFQWTQGPIDGIAGEASASASATPSAGFPVHTAPPEQQNEASGMVSKTTPVGVGLGIGIPLLVIAACLGLLYYRERKARIGAEMLAAQHARRYDSKPPGYVFHTAPSELHDIHRGHASELPGKSIGELRS
ncbi:hypothetical protein AJ79_04105 [Helicocarpus griseus UAMH5409]|uniref:Mid2 domain-containing protein n=1 Tax=Helicocarpus griseus UAMH5409 TaxID=1447875 RepID=A0A2B7XLW2_9EURO|nr:hypothetical protein AJ79_04105 [Helicocarpus griseus UAMH5409]